MKNLLVGATLSITVAAVIKRVARKDITNELETLSASMISDYNNENFKNLLEYSARINSITRSYL